MTKPSQWSLDLATRLLSEAPNSVPLVEVMAICIELERERCAKIADDHAKAWGLQMGTGATEIAKAIRSND